MPKSAEVDRFARTRFLKNSRSKGSRTVIAPNLRAIRLLVVAASLVFAGEGIAEAGDLSGCWSGTWQSCVTSHRGPLSAEFVRLDANRYEVFFNGRFFKLLPFKYSVVMTATEDSGVVTLSGSQYLGRMFGTFSFQASTTDGDFNANYSSCKDNGCFKMTRCTYASDCAGK